MKTDPKAALTSARVIIPAMHDGGAQLFAAAFRAVGIDAEVTPPSDALTLELGSRYTGGDECFPARVTVGDFMKVLANPAKDPAKTVLFMPQAGGPCRFGQYAPYLRLLLDRNGYSQVRILSPTSEDGYEGLGNTARPFLRTAWRALVAADALYKLLLMIRPYEQERGAADHAYRDSIARLSRAIEIAPVEPWAQLRTLVDTIKICRDRFREIKIARNGRRLVIGVVGEIFCRLNSFSNQDIIRHLEEYGAEARVAGVGEWVAYANSEELQRLKLERRLLSRTAVISWLRRRVQHSDEKALLEPLQDDFKGWEEPELWELLEAARPYLPPEGAKGEMVLNVGNAVCFARTGADGVLDISPFTCMNAIVSEAVYPRISADLGGLPIRTLYFDGMTAEVGSDLGIFLEMAAAHRRRALGLRQSERKCPA